jgi:integrase
MASITARKRGDGTTVYTAQIRLKKGGTVWHSEARTFNRRAAAKAWAAEREDQLRSDPASATRADHARLTVGDLILRYITARESIGSLGRTKGSHLRFLLGQPIAAELAVGLTTARVVAHVQARRESGAGGATVSNDLTWLRVVFKYARLALGIAVDPLVLADATDISRSERMIARPQRRKRRPTDDELSRITCWFEAHRPSGRAGSAPMDLAMWAAIYSCRRLSELCRLRMSDYDREHRVWLIRDLKHPGGSAGRDAEMLVTERFAAVIEAILALPGRNPEEPLLLPFDPRTVSARWTRTMKVLGIEDLHFHDLRRCGASRLAEDGWTIPEIQRVTLHDSWSSLQIYVNMPARKVGRVEFKP